MKKEEFEQLKDYSNVVYYELPKEYKNADTFIEIMKDCPGFFYGIPKSKITKKIVLKYIEYSQYKNIVEWIAKDWENFFYLPKNMYEEEIVDAFFTYGKFNNQNVDDELGVQYSDYDNNPKWVEFEYLLKWEKVCYKAVGKYHCFIKYVPKEFLSIELCKHSIQENEHTHTLEYIPQEYKTKDICNLAFDKHIEAIEFIPQELIDEEMANRAINYNGLYLKYIPEKLKTYMLCLDAMKSTNGRAFDYVPDEIKDEEICLLAITPKENGWSLYIARVPEKCLTYKVCLAAVEANGCQIDYVPVKCRDEKLCMTAVTNYGDALKDVPVDIISKQMCLNAINNHVHSFNYVPFEFYDEEIKKAVEDNLYRASSWAEKAKLEELMKQYDARKDE